MVTVTHADPRNDGGGPYHRSMDNRARGAIAGAAAAAVALAVGELVAAIAPRSPSLVVGVGGWVIDRSPGDATRAAIAAFGTANKPVLITTIVVVSLLLGGVFGIVARRRAAAGIAGFTAFAVLGALASSGEVGASAGGTVLVATVTLAAGVGTLVLLLIAAEGRLPLQPAEIESPVDPHASRRAFLGFAGAASAFAGLTATGARIATGRSSAEVAREAIVLPPARSPSETVSTTAPVTSSDGIGFDTEGLSPLYTPNDRFFRIDTALRLPQVDPDDWSLTIDGLVDQSITLTFDELAAMPLVEADVTLACVSNEVGGSLVGNARWLGVPLADLFDQVGVQPDARQVVGRSVDGFTAGFPRAVMDDGRPVLVAIGMNGEPLPIRHGFPARLVVSGLYGYVSATKWLANIELTTWEGFDGYWIPRGWSKEGPIHTQTRIDVPKQDTTVAPGTVAIAGVAWAPSRGIERVEVRIDDEPWTDATLSDPIGDHAWRQWVLRWEAAPGEHVVEVRATDGTGEVQTDVQRPPAPSGATGRHRIMVEVR
jgi:DMSO/TMAO reductase YedYZ molybdopterin-dependent catalytic subunit